MCSVLKDFAVQFGVFALIYANVPRGYVTRIASVSQRFPLYLLSALARRQAGRCWANADGKYNVQSTWCKLQSVNACGRIVGRPYGAYHFDWLQALVMSLQSRGREKPPCLGAMGRRSYARTHAGTAPLHCRFRRWRAARRAVVDGISWFYACLLYTSPSPRD